MAEALAEPVGSGANGDTGDPTQIDLPHHKISGLVESVRALRQTAGISIVEFSRKDVVRHPLVQRIIEAYEEQSSRRTGEF